MNKKQTLTIAAAFLFAIQTKAQNNIPQANIPQANIPPRTVVQQQSAVVHIFKVGSVNLSIDSSVHVTNGAGAVKHYFRAVINSIGTGTIQYQWVLLNHGNTPNNHPSIVQGTLQLNGNGTDVIFTERDRVTGNPQKTLTLEIISPNNLSSNQITY